MAYQTKNSVVAVVVETTEGTPVVPTSATQYVPVEEGYSLEPAFEVLDSAELSGSIGKAKSTLGSETPTASMDLYFKSSGAEGVEPTYGVLLHAALGDKSINATEYTLTAGSTAGTSSVRATLKSTGNATNFERGEGVLIKDGTNGYRVRNVFAPSGANDILLSFNLPAAPASGVTLGKASLYKPGGSHPTFTLWDFRGNNAAVQAVTGCRVTELKVQADAGQFVNGSYSVEGIGFYYDPINITSTDIKLDFNETGPTLRAATVTARLYKDPHELAAALQTAMNDVATDVITVVYSDSTGKFTISSAGTLLELLWSSGTNAANTIGDKIGFVTASDDTGATTYTSDNAQSLSSPQVPNFDDVDPFVAKSNEVLLGDFDDNSCFCVESISLTISNTKADSLCICSDSGKQGSVITGREVTLELSAELQQYDADKFRRLREGTSTSFAYTCGVKSGGNWVPGKVMNMYLPTATITSLALDDRDGLVVVNLTLTAFVQDGLGEVYVNGL